jgi:CP family cyanate transporter-like MFS transporter
VTGVYATGINVGSALAAGLALPLSVAFNWRAALAVLSLAGMIVVVPLSRCRAPKAVLPPSLKLRSLPFRDPSAWRLVTMFALLTVCYYGMTTWLSSYYGERSGIANPGLLVATLNASAVLGSLGVPVLSQWLRATLPVVIAAAAFAFMATIVGLTVLPAGWPAWVSGAGAANGALFALLLSQPLELRNGADALNGLAAMMLGFGYAFGSAAPTLLGALRDATGGFQAVLWSISAAAAALSAVSCAHASRHRAGIGAARSTPR